MPAAALVCFADSARVRGGVSYTPDAERNARYAAEWPSVEQVAMTSGKRVEQRVDHPAGAA